MPKLKNTIPVFDICSLNSSHPVSGNLIAEPFGEYLKVHPNLHTPHRHSFYHLVFFTRGKGYHTIDFEQFNVRKGQVYFMVPGQVHSWSFEGDTDGYVVNFSEDLFHSFLTNTAYPEQFAFFKGIASDSVYQLNGSVYTQACSIFETIIREAKGKEVNATDIIRACLVQLFIIVQRTNPAAISAQVPQQTQLILSNFRKLVDACYAEKRLPKEYAAMLYITPNHLNALSKDLLGKSAGELIRDRILLEAKRLLINLDKSIAEIGYQLSFSDNSHFTKFFKKYTNVTPEEFRRASTGSNKKQ